MVPFLRQLADHLLHAHGTTLRDVAVVLPSRRAATWLRRRLAEAARTPLWSPEIHTFPTLAERLSGLTPVDPLTGAFLLHQVQQDLFPQEAWSLDETLNIAPTLLADMSEVDAHLIDLKGLYRDLTAFSEIEDWSFRLGNDMSPGQQRHRTFWQRQGRIHERFNTLLMERGMGTSGALERFTVERLAGRPVTVPWRSVWVAGVNALSPAEEGMLDAFQARGSLRVAWDGDESYVGDPRHEAGESLRRLIERYGPGEIPLSRGSREQERKVEVVLVPNPTSQVHALADRLMQLGPGEHERTAVVLPEEHLLIPLLAAMPSELQPFNVTMGLRLHGLPVSSLARALFTAHLHHDEDRGFRVEHLMEWFHHPFLVGSAASTTALRTVHEVRYQWIDGASLSNMLDELPPQLAAPVREALDPVRSARSDLHARALAVIHWALSQDPPPGLVREQLHAWATLLQRLNEHLHLVPGEMDIRTWMGLHDRALRQERLDLEGEPLRGLQIMGFLETRALDHDRIFMLSCNEGALPPAQTARSFIPHDIRRVLGLPLPAHGDKVNAYHFHRAMQRTREAVLFHHEGSGDDTAEPSRYLAQWRSDSPPSGPTVWRETVCMPQDAIHDATTIKVWKTPAIMRLIEERLARGLSPSTIAAYLNCPLDFLHGHIWSKAPKEPATARIPSDALGSAVHAVYDALYAPFAGKQIPAEAFTMDRERIQAMLMAHLRSAGVALELDRGEPLLQIRMASSAIERNLAQESLIAGKEPVELIAVERTLSGTLNVDGSVVPLSGRADRIERRNGIVHVFDLKTGTVETRKLELFGADGTVLRDRTMALQLAVYAMLVLKDIPGCTGVKAGIIPLRKPSLAQDAYLRVQKSDTFTHMHAETVTAFLKEVIREIRDPATPFAHRSEARFCRFCVV